jgi:hypothetical protein
MTEHEPVEDGRNDFVAFAADIVVAAIVVVLICTTMVRCVG